MVVNSFLFPLDLIKKKSTREQKTQLVTPIQQAKLLFDKLVILLFK
jgi:hypothetical protein